MKDGKILAKKLIDGDRKSLAKAMTLVCSHLEKDKKESKILIETVLKVSKPSYKIGVSGIGGVGKSSFIEVLGQKILDENKNLKLGVLTIDPSSPENGGSVLADSVRMPNLVQNERAFIRSVSNKSSSGGLSQEAWELVLLFEGAGCDYVIIESVGTGQSDDLISLLCDLSILLQMPASGDNMQAIKKGSVEKADILVIHKNDGILKKEAEKAALLYKQTQHLLEAMKKRDHPPVLLVSSVEETGFEELLFSVKRLESEQTSSGELDRERQKDCLKAFDHSIETVLRERLQKDENLIKIKDNISKDLFQRKTSPILAARAFLDRVL